MKIEEWEQRYRSGERAAEDLYAPPTPLVIQTASNLPPGSALDIACGTGRNALWLAEHGWQVDAVDGARVAIEILEQRARERGLNINARVADLEALTFTIPPASYDLICDCYYLQRSLFSGIRAGLRPGGIVIAIVHLARPGEEITYKHAAPGELREFFAGWDILHYREGDPIDEAHKRGVAELVARKPPETAAP